MRSKTSLRPVGAALSWCASLVGVALPKKWWSLIAQLGGVVGVSSSPNVIAVIDAFESGAFIVVLYAWWWCCNKKQGNKQDSTDNFLSKVLIISLT